MDKVVAESGWRFAGRVTIRSGLALLLACSATELRAETLAPGSAAEGHIQLAGKQIPLPEGSWTVAGHGYDRLPGSPDIAYGAIENVVLFKTEGPTVVAFVIAQRNVVGVENGWGIATECRSPELLAAVTYDSADGHASCGFVTYTLTTVDDRSASAWRDALEYAGTNGLQLPNTWLTAGFRFSDMADVLDLRYSFNPDQQGVPPGPMTGWADSPWSRAKVFGTVPSTGVWATITGVAHHAAFWADEAPKREPPASPAMARRAELVNDLKEWLARLRFPVRLGFENRATMAGVLPMPWSGTPAGPLPEEAYRMAVLDELKSEGAISEQDFAQQKMAAARLSATLAGVGWTAEQLTAVKALTDQVSGAVSYFSADFLYTGSVTRAAQVWAFDQVLDGVRYTAQEYAWQRIGPRRLAGDLVVDLPPAGIDG